MTSTPRTTSPAPAPTYRLLDLVPELPDLIAAAALDLCGALTVRIEAGRVTTAGHRTYLTPEGVEASLAIIDRFPDFDPFEGLSQTIWRPDHDSET